MKLRQPATPLITVDPYFSVWSFSDKLNESDTVHWTGSPNTIIGTVTVDGKEYRFMGNSKGEAIEQTGADMSALVTDYEFENSQIKLFVSFYTPLFPDDLYRMSRPVSYLTAKYKSADGNKHNVKLGILVSEEICINKKGEDSVHSESGKTKGGLEYITLASDSQKMLERSGDDLRIEWGTFYLAGAKGSSTVPAFDNGMAFAAIEDEMKEGENCTVLFAYDDNKCLNYFGDFVDAYWKKKGISILEAIDEAFNEQEQILALCRIKSEELESEAKKAGGSKYAELLSLAFRQTICAHKLALDKDGEVIFISKECFSNGCAATVDVTYPSAPFMLLYNTELLKGTLRPIFKYAVSPAWPYDFAPHDVGTYPIVTGQKYGSDHEDDPVEYLKRQMPVEESGNMLILMAAIAMLDKSTDFCDDKMDILKGWVRYLIDYGDDPENQLCTDDFAGHLAHNCNLSIKAIMGIEAYAKILEMKGCSDAKDYHEKAVKMAEGWSKRAANPDGSFRLAFDRPGTFSMKYNAVWDKLWGTEVFEPCVINSEICSNKRHFNAYGMPLDNRKTYTKSDWIVWTATLAPTREEFKDYIAPLWDAYNKTPSRCPMTDWYDTVSSEMVGFRHRTVVGGLFIKLLEGKF